MSAIAAIKTSSILSATESTTSATVGVDKTFDPEGFIAPGVARYVDRAAGIAAGFPYITFSVRPPSKEARVYRVTARVGIPTMETVGTAPYIPGPKVAYNLLGTIEFVLPERSSAAERALLFSTVRSLFATTIQASDAAPTDLTLSPLIAGVNSFESVY
jgi:hypothetical protein